MGKNFFLISHLNLPSFSSEPLPLVLSLHALCEYLGLRRRGASPDCGRCADISHHGLQRGWLTLGSTLFEANGSSSSPSQRVSNSGDRLCRARTRTKGWFSPRGAPAVPRRPPAVALQSPDPADGLCLRARRLRTHPPESSAGCASRFGGVLWGLILTHPHPSGTGKNGGEETLGGHLALPSPPGRTGSTCADPYFFSQREMKQIWSMCS